MMRWLVLTLALLIAQPAVAGGLGRPISRYAFGTTYNYDTSRLLIPMGSGRFWDGCKVSRGCSPFWNANATPCPAGTGAGQYGWMGTETSRGVHDWQNGDALLVQHQRQGMKPTLVFFGRNPPWATGNGRCGDPPLDYQDFWNYVRAAVTRYGNQVDYEFGNEMNLAIYNRSLTPQQAVSLFGPAYDIIKSIAPAARVFAPSVTGNQSGASGMAGPLWLQKYADAGGLLKADAVPFHAYPWNTITGPPQLLMPEQVAGMINQYQNIMASAGVDLPLAINEFDQDAGGGVTEADPAYIANTVLLCASLIDQCVEYAGDSTGGYGTLTGSLNGLSMAGRGMGIVARELIGATPTALPARQKGTNRVPNPTLSGGCPPGSFPSGGWTQFNGLSGNGITTASLGCSVINGKTVLAWRFNGTAGANGSINIIPGTTYAPGGSMTGTWWTFTVKVALAPGCVGWDDVNFNVQAVQMNGGSFIQQIGAVRYFPNTLSVDRQTYWSNTAQATSGSVNGIRGDISFGLTSGVTYDCTVYVTDAELDDGTRWTADYTRGDGTAIQAAWDVAATATTPINYTAPAWANWLRRTDSIHYDPIVGNVAPLTNAVSFLRAQQQPFVFPPRKPVPYP